MDQDEVREVLAELRSRVHGPLVAEGREAPGDSDAALVEESVEMAD
jgi:hypothetical protein